ncbi:hypothetical protein ACOMHN_006745 [Nucella lapillus]
MGNVIRIFLRLWTTPKKPVPKREPIFFQLAFQAARKGDVEGLRKLQDDPDVPEKVPLQLVEDSQTGTTLLHVAMQRGHTELLLLLLRAGCDLHRGDRSGETPLHAACMGDKAESLKVALNLSEVKVDLEVKDVWRRTLLLKAMTYGSERAVQFLLTRDVDLDAQDSFRLSVAHVAATRNRVDLLRELARRGANLNPVQSHGRSPLSLAITSLLPDMVRELLILGASTCQPSSSSSSFPPLPCITAIQEFVRRAEMGGVVCAESEEILHTMLAAHGNPLHSDEPNVFQRVLYMSDVARFLPLLHKVLVCSDSLVDDWPTDRSNAAPRTLFELARRSARQALMASGRNVLWAVERLSLSLPPALKGVLLLKDCDFKECPLVQ